MRPRDTRGDASAISMCTTDQWHPLQFEYGTSCEEFFGRVIEREH
jgi:hypothetical protein